MSQLGPGCVKARGRASAIEQVSRSRSLSVLALQAPFNFNAEQKNMILVALRDFEFSHSLDQKLTSAAASATSAEGNNRTYPTEHQQAPALRPKGSCRHAAHSAAKPGMTVSANRRMFSREPWPNSST